MDQSTVDRLRDELQPVALTALTVESPLLLLLLLLLLPSQGLG